MEEQSKVKQLEMDLKSAKERILSLKEMLRGSKKTEDLKDIAAQTDENSNFRQPAIDRKDFEVQVNSSAFTLSEMKEEAQIAMPNRPTSNAENPSKKIKLTNSRRKSKVSQTTGDDLSILNPEVFKTFCSIRRDFWINQFIYCNCYNSGLKGVLTDFDPVFENPNEIFEICISDLVYDQIFIKIRELLENPLTHP